MEDAETFGSRAKMHQSRGFGTISVLNFVPGFPSEKTSWGVRYMITFVELEDFCVRARDVGYVEG